MGGIFSIFFKKSCKSDDISVEHENAPKTETKPPRRNIPETFTTFTTRRSVTLGSKLGEGGEGSVYTIAEHPRIVAKLYSTKNRTQARETKLRRLLAKGIDPKEAAALRIAMPLDILLDTRGNFAGYLMPMVEGTPLKNAFFSRKRLETRFPRADRRVLVAYAHHFVRQLRYLHAKNILVGDINPLNLMVDPASPEQGWLIDTDSFQIDELPCPVGTDIFTPPNLQGRNFRDTLRTIDDELFSAAIMIFMILMIGKHPYSRIGGENPADNIRKHAFPYCSLGSLDEVPAGVWGYIWSHFPRNLKRGFERVFREDERIELQEWEAILKEYTYLLDRGFFSDDIVPLSFRSRNAVTVTCRDCRRDFRMDAKFHEKLIWQNKEPICALCRQKIKAGQLIRKNGKTIPETVKHARFNARKFQYKAIQ